GGRARPDREAESHGRLRQLPLHPDRDPDRPHPGVARLACAVCRERRLPRRAAVPALRGRARARRDDRRPNRARLARRASRFRADLRGRDELPARLMATPTLDASRLAALKVGPTAITADARWLMAYAAALGERDPRYYDTTAPDGPLVHPLFPVCYEWPLAQAVRTTAMDEATARRGVHAYHRAVVHLHQRPGD